MKATVGATAAMAGCMGSDGGDGGPDRDGNGDGDGNGSGDGDGQSGRVERYMRRMDWAPPGEANLNYWGTNFPWGIWYANSNTRGYYSITGEKWMKIDAKSFEFRTDPTPSEFRVTMHPGITWTDGKKVLGKDWAIHHEIDRLLVPEDSRRESPLVTGWRGEDETIVYELNDEAGWNEAAVRDQVLFWPKLAPGCRRGSVFEEKLQALKDATSKDEKDAIRTEITKVELKLPDVQFPGPYVPESASKNQAIFETNFDHALAKKNNINWTGFKSLYFGSRDSSREAQLFKSNKIDIVNAMIPPQITVADYHHLITSEEFGGPGIGFNYGYGPGGKQVQQKNLMPILKDHRVRRAIAYMLPRGEISKSTMSTLTHAPVDKPAGMHPNQVQRHFPDLWEKLDSYERNEENLKKAERLMNEAGVERQDGKWVTSDGKPLKLSYISIPTGDAGRMGQAVVSWLKDWGIEATFSAVPEAQFGPRVQNGDFQMVSASWGGGPALTSAFQGLFRPGLTDTNPPATFKAPETVGDWESSLVDYNTFDLVTGLRNQPLDEGLEELKKLIWVYNYNQPRINLLHDSSGAQLNNKTFSWPDPPAKTRKGLPYRFANEDDPPIYGTEQPPSVMMNGTAGPDYEIKARPKK